MDLQVELYSIGQGDEDHDCILRDWFVRVISFQPAALFLVVLSRSPVSRVFWVFREGTPCAGALELSIFFPWWVMCVFQKG